MKNNIIFDYYKFKKIIKIKININNKLYITTFLKL